MRILIVEDEQPIAKGLRFNFEQEGFETVVASNGPDALTALQDGENPIDLVVLDLMLPGMSGYEISKEIRQTNSVLPILVLSARSLSQDKAHAFDCGADQYVTKPFDLEELLSRVRNLLKRNSDQANHREFHSESPKEFHFDGIAVCFDQFEVLVGDKKHRLTTMEMQLLQHFILHQGVVLSRARILEDVWGQSGDITNRSVDNFVMRLRRIIEPDPSNPRYLLSVRGTGYRFAPVGELEAPPKT